MESVSKDVTDLQSTPGRKCCENRREPSQQWPESSGSGEWQGRGQLRALRGCQGSGAEARVCRAPGRETVTCKRHTNEPGELQSCRVWGRGSMSGAFL